jgi:hypothetical protein
MKLGSKGMVFALVVAWSFGATLPIESADNCSPRMPSPAFNCQPRQQVQPVARQVRVTVPVPPPAVPCAPPVCGPSPMYGPRPCSPPPPARPMPVRVDIAVSPETCDQREPVPVVFRDPGFLRPVVAHSVRHGHGAVRADLARARGRRPVASVLTARSHLRNSGATRDPGQDRESDR